MKNKIEARKKLLEYVRFQKAGNSEKAVDVVRSIFEPIIQHDNKMWCIEDAYDVLALLAFHLERAHQMKALVEMEFEKASEEVRQSVNDLEGLLKEQVAAFLIEDMIKMLDE